MLSQCPHCHKELQLSEAQQEKVRQALAALPEGKTLKIACPLCREAIHLRRDGNPVESAGATAAQATPTAPAAAETRDAEQAAAKPVAPPPQPVNPPPTPPAAPDISWLQGGEGQQADLDEVVRDQPLAMVLVGDEGLRRQVAEALATQEYLVEFPESAAAAKERMRFVNFAAVVLHTDFEGGALQDSLFHQHMRKLPMAARRHILYALLGPELRTLYDLEALALSANLVVNQQDAGKLPLILKKAAHDYQALFGPYLDALREHGKL